MIIGIDISSLPYGTGVSNYTENLLRHLLKNDKVNTYKIFFSSYRQPLPKIVPLLLKNKNARLYHYHLPPTFFQIVWNKLHILPIELFIGKCDVFHTWDWTQPPSIKAKLVTTIHDFVPLLFPETQHPKTIKNFHSKMYWSIKECSGIICVSTNTLQDLAKLFPQVPTSKIKVIFEAAEDKYHQFHRLPKSVQQQKFDLISRQYDLKKYILAQGTREPRKNLSRLISAFNLYRKVNPSSPYQLAIAGKYGWGADINQQNSPNVKILGYIPEKNMVALHAAATALCYPSLYEGFGLPILKSMHVGVPVITSNLSSLPEVAGDAALLVDPTKINDIADKISSILKKPSLRLKLSRRGIKQAALFSWDKTAIETLNFYQEISNDNRHRR